MDKQTKGLLKDSFALFNLTMQLTVVSMFDCQTFAVRAKFMACDCDMILKGLPKVEAVTTLTTWPIH